MLATVSALSTTFVPAQPAAAIQGYTAGRIPGVSSTPDEDGFYTYSRPEGKSGGHGVGWSEIPRYHFKIPPGWEEIPVSIADLGGTEIDLRYTSKKEGDVAVVVAPVMRFADISFNAKVKIEQLGDPAKIIKGFGPELFGKPIDDENILETEVNQYGGLTYYTWRVNAGGNKLVQATATKNRVFIMAVSATTIQWRKHEQNLRAIQRSFRVDEV